METPGSLAFLRVQLSVPLRKPKLLKKELTFFLHMERLSSFLPPNFSQIIFPMSLTLFSFPPSGVICLHSFDPAATGCVCVCVCAHVCTCTFGRVEGGRQAGVVVIGNHLCISLPVLPYCSVHPQLPWVIIPSFR